MGTKAPTRLKNIWDGGVNNILTTFGGLNNIWSYREKRCPESNFPTVKVKDMYATHLLVKKPEKINLHIATNDVTFKSGTNIRKDLIELKDFILEKLPSCKKITRSSPTVRAENIKKAQRKTMKFLQID